MSVHRTVVCLGVATGCLSVLCIVLSGLLAWRLVTTLPGSEGGVEGTMTNLTQINATFPGYFRTPREQAVYEANVGSARPQKVPVLNTSLAYSCYSNSQCIKNEKPYTPPSINNTLTRRRRQVDNALPCALDKKLEDDLTFHGCCISDSYTAAPDYLTSASASQPKQVQIAQFPGINQYFEIEQCCQARGCDGCQCSQTFYVTSAIVVRTLSNGGKRYEADFVSVPGCCKCLNSAEVPHQARGCNGCQCSQTFYVTSAITVRTLSNGGKLYEVEFVLVPGCCKCLNSRLWDNYEEWQMYQRYQEMERRQQNEK